MEEQNIQQSAQPVQPVVPNVQPGEKKDSNLLYFGIIVVIAILIISGYLTYANFFMSKTSNTKSQTSATVQVAEYKDEEIKTVADQLFQSEKDLNTALEELDKADINGLSDELAKNDSDASGFSQ